MGHDSDDVLLGDGLDRGADSPYPLRHGRLRPLTAWEDRTERAIVWLTLVFVVVAIVSILLMLADAAK